MLVVLNQVSIDRFAVLDTNDGVIEVTTRNKLLKYAQELKIYGVDLKKRTVSRGIEPFRAGYALTNSPVPLNSLDPLSVYELRVNYDDNCVYAYNLTYPQVPFTREIWDKSILRHNIINLIGSNDLPLYNSGLKYLPEDLRKFYSGKLADSRNKFDGRSILFHKGHLYGMQFDTIAREVEGIFDSRDARKRLLDHLSSRKYDVDSLSVDSVSVNSIYVYSRNYATADSLSLFCIVKVKLVDADYFRHEYISTLLRLKVEEGIPYHHPSTSKASGGVFRMFNLYNFDVSMFRVIFYWNVRREEIVSIDKFREVKPHAIPLNLVEIRR